MPVDIGLKVTDQGLAALIKADAALRDIDRSAAKAGKAIVAYERAQRELSTEPTARQAAELSRMRDAAVDAARAHRDLAARQDGTRESAITAAAAAASLAGRVVAIGSALLRSAADAERHQRALHALGGGYAQVQAATHGAVTAEDAFRTQQVLLQSGLHATTADLAVIARAGREWARAAGVEAADGVRQLTDALVQGDAGGLRRFGVAVQQGATRTQVLSTALDQLAEAQRRSAPSALSAAESQERFGEAAKHATGSLALFLSKHLALTRMLTETSGLLDTLSADTINWRRAIDQLPGALDALARTARAAQLGPLGVLLNRFGPAAPEAQPAALPVPGRPRRGPLVTVPEETPDQRASREAVEEIERTSIARVNALAAAAKEGRGRGGGRRRPTVEQLIAGAFQGEQALVGAAGQTLPGPPGEATHEELLAKGAGIAAERRTGLEARRAALDLARQEVEAHGQLARSAAAARAEGRALTAQEAAATADRTERLQRLVDLERGYRTEIARADAELRAAQTEESRNATLVRRLQLLQQLQGIEADRRAAEAEATAATHAFGRESTAALGQAAEAWATTALQAAIAGEITADSAQKALSGVLAALAQKALVKSLEQTAEGVTALAGVFTAPLAPGHFAAAALWGGVAAAAGLGAGLLHEPATRGAASPAVGGALPPPAARAETERPSREESPLALSIVVNGALLNEGVEEGIVRALDRAAARGLRARHYERRG